jgi:hypothetical protein
MFLKIDGGRTLVQPPFFAAFILGVCLIGISVPGVYHAVRMNSGVTAGLASSAG